MSRPKFTVRLSDIVDEVNRLNRESVCSPDVRKGWNSLCEKLMMANENYDGFGYLTKEQMMIPAHHMPPGIILGYNEQGERDNSKNVYPDETRRVYYLKKR